MCEKKVFCWFFFLTSLDTPKDFACTIKADVCIILVNMYTNAYMLLHVEMSNFLLKTWGKPAPQVRHLEVRQQGFK